MLIAAPGALRHAEEIWGTVVTIDVNPPLDFAALAPVVDEAVEFMHRVDRLFSTYQPDSLVSRYRREEIDLADLDPANPDHFSLLYLVERIRHGMRLTDGAFDPWAALGGFDTSGIVKGIAAEEVANMFVRSGFPNVMVNAGGDVVCRGESAPGQPWVVGVRHPDEPGSIVHTFSVFDGAIATSGSYERGGHIRDPHTGEVASGARSATVVGPDAGIAEILATALIVAGREGAEWFGGLPGWQAYVVDQLPVHSAWQIG